MELACKLLDLIRKLLKLSLVTWWIQILTNPHPTTPILSPPDCQTQAPTSPLLSNNWHTSQPTFLQPTIKLPSKMFIYFRRIKIVRNTSSTEKESFRKSISCSAPKVWNNLPSYIRTSNNISCFKRRLIDVSTAVITSRRTVRDLSFTHWRDSQQGSNHTVLNKQSNMNWYPQWIRDIAVRSSDAGHCVSSFTLYRVVSF